MFFCIGMVQNIAGLETLQSPGILSFTCGHVQDAADVHARLRVQVLGQLQIRQHLRPSQRDSVFMQRRRFSKCTKRHF